MCIILRWRTLEAESVHAIREVAAGFENPTMLYFRALNFYPRPSPLNGTSVPCRTSF